MGWGFWRKLKAGIKKAASWVANKVKKVTHKGLDVVSKTGTAIGGALGAAYGNPQAGLQAGSIAQNLAGGLKGALPG